MLAQQRREVTYPRKPSTKREEALTKQFEEYYTNKWVDTWFYLPIDFIREFGIDRHLAGYYLMKMTREGKLFRVKYSNKTYYRKFDKDRFDRYREFIWFGVEVTNK